MKKIVFLLAISSIVLAASCNKATQGEVQKVETEGIEIENAIETEDEEPKYSTLLEWDFVETQIDEDERCELYLSYTTQESHQIVRDSLFSIRGIAYKDILCPKKPTKDTIYSNRKHDVEIIYSHSTEYSDFHISMVYKGNTYEYLAFQENEKGTRINRDLWTYDKLESESTILAMNPDSVNDKEWTESVGEFDTGFYSYLLLPSSPKKSYETLFKLLEERNDEDVVQMQRTLPTKDTIYSGREEFEHARTIYRFKDAKIDINISYEGGVTEYILEKYGDTNTKVTRIMYPD